MNENTSLEKIDEFVRGMPPRAIKILKQYGINTLKDLRRTCCAHLMLLPTLGSSTVKRIAYRAMILDHSVAFELECVRDLDPLANLKGVKKRVKAFWKHYRSPQNKDKTFLKIPGWKNYKSTLARSK